MFIQNQHLFPLTVHLNVFLQTYAVSKKYIRIRSHAICILKHEYTWMSKHCDWYAIFEAVIWNRCLIHHRKQHWRCLQTWNNIDSICPTYPVTQTLLICCTTTFCWDTQSGKRSSTNFSRILHVLHACSSTLQRFPWYTCVV